MLSNLFSLQGHNFLNLRFSVGFWLWQTISLSKHLTKKLSNMTQRNKALHAKK